MKRRLKMGMYGLMAVMMVMGSGCTQKAGSKAETTAAATEAPESSQATQSGPVDPGKVESLGKYLGVSYTPMPTQVSDEEVEDRIQALLDANPTLEKVDRAAKEGDAVDIDYVGKKDGEAFDGGTGNIKDLVLGSGEFIEGFEEGLIGAVAGQKLSLNLTFPENYGSKELAGQAVVFDVTVNAVQEVIKAELSDEFIKEHTDSATVEEYRKAVRAEMEESALLNAEEQKKYELLFQVLEGSQVTVPEESVQAVYDRQRLSYEQQAQMFGMDLETMVSYYGMDLEGFEKEILESARLTCKQNAVVRAIAAAERITVEEKDREEMAKNFGYDTVEALTESAGEDVVNDYILTEKVVQLIVDNAVEE